LKCCVIDSVIKVVHVIGGNSLVLANALENVQMIYLFVNEYIW